MSINNVRRGATLALKENSRRKTEKAVYGVTMPYYVNGGHNVTEKGQ